MNNVKLFLIATRARTLPVMLAPVVVGAVLAWQQEGMFQWGWFFLTLLGALAAHLGANVTNDVYDFDTGADQAAHDIMPEGQTLVTGSNMLLNKRLSLRSYRLIAVSCFAVALLCGILLSLIRPYVLVFGVLGFLLAFFYVAPPLRLAYIGRGLGELDILISFGILPVIGSYYVQAGKVSLAAFLVALPIGLYTTAVLYFHHFLHWRADRAVGKITPVVALGERGARFAGALLLLLIAVTIILAIILQALPWYSCIAILTILPVQLRLRKASGDLKNYLQLMATNLNSNVQTALLIVVALIVRGIAHV
ncbi:MAG TPA: prenyltransferase [Ktedonobacteraceae bacterium]|jgi:1,4-dihydroxy-2-naphthoate octaprenyltransferase|nr:prenyltransferase [Ktedonobacteraceae bacterium]